MNEPYRPNREGDMVRHDHVVLFVDGVPDCTGDAFKPDTVSWSPAPVPVRCGMGGPEIGHAVLRLEGNQIVATMSIDRSLVIELSKCVPAIQGMGFPGTKRTLATVRINSIGICKGNCDPRIPPFDVAQGNQEERT